MPLWLLILILVSMLAGLLFAAFGLWLNFKEKQIEIGTSMSELVDTVAAQQKALEAAERRFQNLEAIVTSQVWDVIHDEHVPEAEREHVLSGVQTDLHISEEEPSDAEQVARIARRLKM